MRKRPGCLLPGPCRCLRRMRCGFPDGISWPSHGRPAPSCRCPLRGGRGKIGVSLPAKSGRWGDDAAIMVKALAASGYVPDAEFAGNDAPTQLQQSQDMISAGVRALVIAPVDGTSLAAFPRQCRGAEYPRRRLRPADQAKPQRRLLRRFRRFPGRRGTGALAGAGADSNGFAASTPGMSSFSPGRRATSRRQAILRRRHVVLKPCHRRRRAGGALGSDRPEKLRHHGLGQRGGAGADG